MKARALSNQFAEIITVRCSRPLYSSQPTHPHPPRTPGQPGAPDRPGNQGALPQNPDSMPPPHTQGHPPPADHHDHNSPSSPPQRARLLCQHQTSQPPRENKPTRHSRPPSSSARASPQPAQTHQQPEQDQNSQEATPTQSILRKEVIQPHLPVRLPCYDFVPITSPTFDRSP